MGGILANGPETFAGRKVGALVTNGTDAGLLAELRAALDDEGTMLELIAPTVGGVTLSDGKKVPADQKIDGGPSVLWDAVAILCSDDGADVLARDAVAKDFVTDAFAHAKFIGWSETARTLLEGAGVADIMDDGFIDLGTDGGSASFVAACRALRCWDREDLVKQT